MVSFVKKQHESGTTSEVLIGLLVVTLLIILELSYSLSLAVIDLDVSKAGTVVVNWDSRKKTERSFFLSKTAHVNPGQNSLFFMLWSWRDLHKITIKPLNQSADIQLNNIVIKRVGEQSAIFNTDEHFQKFRFNNGFSQIKPVADKLFLTVKNASAEIQIPVSFKDFSKHKFPPLEDLTIKLLAIGAAFILGYCIYYLYKKAYLRYINFILLIVIILYHYFNIYSTTVDIELRTHQPGKMSVYWADQGDIYRQKYSASLETNPQVSHYQFKIQNLNNVNTLRINPIPTKGQVIIESIKINEPGYLPINLNRENNFFAVDLNLKSVLNNKLTGDTLSFNAGNLVFNTTSGEDFFEILIDPEAFKVDDLFKRLLGLVGIIGLLYFSITVFRKKLPPNDNTLLTFICQAGMAFILLQVIWLANVSAYDAHPDENAHINSIDYFSQYSDFPAIGDGRAMDAYQKPWGISRLDDLGISYFLMGKFKNLLTMFIEDSVFTCRAFNSFLVALLVSFAYQKRFAIFCIPILVLPQVWYLFSYANRDAFALFLSILAAWQIADRHSFLNTSIKQSTIKNSIKYLLVPAVLIGLLSIEISNYAIFILFSLAVLIWEGVYYSGNKAQYFQKLLILLVLASSIFGIRKAIDIDVNGLKKQAQREAFQEAIAEPMFKPSVAVTDKGFFSLRLQKKGVEAIELLSPKWDWLGLIFKSFAGAYGNEHMEFSPEWYFRDMKYLYWLIGLVAVVSSIRSGNRKLMGLMALTLVFVFGNLLMGFLFSWLYDFQPQGRYIFPLIPMLMVFITKASAFWGNKTKTLLLSCALFMFVLGLFSFQENALEYMVEE